MAGNTDRYGDDLSVPIELAELLHAALGPLADVLEEEDHPWAAMARRVLDEYTFRRNRLLKYIYGESIAADIAHHTFQACEKVCELTDSAVREAVDFVKWSSEVERSSEVNGDHV